MAQLLRHRFLGVFAALALALACAVVPAGAAHAAVIYQGGSHTLAVQDADGRPLNDLFSGFKNVMPGDALTQQIVVANDAASGTPVKLYLRSTGAQTGSADFLSQLNLSVVAEGGSKLFDAPPSEAGSLADWVLLGTFEPGAKATLDLTLEVPITMGNEFQDATGTLGWEFMAEELVEDGNGGDNGNGSGGGNSGAGGNSDTNNGFAPGSPSHPAAKTGDPLNPVPLVVVALGALVAMVLHKPSRD
ncbi:hypothetical protein [Gordonibacter sp.]|uniref:hypothetical protein n=1 Tax=Gordonibacter sp. TaxID=1968902 RepID=UPI0025C057C6|nr:hypothetical protein [Gordonibacter sp.]